jgi:UDP-N-acetylmuramoyl-tripeptide--D-alanyl-D-alanine ligase
LAGGCGRRANCVGDPERVVGNITTDSRSLQGGDFFIALRGARFDAHAFVNEVLERGALGVLVEEIPARDFAPDTVVIAANDTTRALQDLAHAVREATATKVVAITGSAGKTTTKDTIADFLSASHRVVKNKGNLNNHIGLPLSLLQLRDKPDVAVMELGMNHAGEIRTLVAIADPDVRVWTNVGDAHIGFFASPDAIADAKAEILEAAEPHDVLVCNADDGRVMARAIHFAGRVVTFGEVQGASVRAIDIEDRGVNGMRARVATPAGEHVIETPLLGRGNLANVLAATAVALEFGVPLDTIAARAAALRPPIARGAVHRSAAASRSSTTPTIRVRPRCSARSRCWRRKHAARARLQCSARCWSSARTPTTSTANAAARAAAPASAHCSPSVERRTALADEAVAAGMTASHVTYYETSDAARRRSPGHSAPETLCW